MMKSGATHGRTSNLFSPTPSKSGTTTSHSIFFPAAAAVAIVLILLWLKKLLERMRGAGLFVMVVVGLKNVRVEEEKKGRQKRLFKLLWRACPSWRVRDREAMVRWVCGLTCEDVHWNLDGYVRVKRCGAKEEGLLSDYIRAKCYF